MATTAELQAVLKLRDEFSGRLGKIEKQVGTFRKKQERATKTTGQFGKGISDLVSRVTPLNPAMLGAAGGIAAVGAAAVKAVGDTVRFGTQLVDLSSKTGLTVQQLQEFKFAGDQAGVGFDRITDAVLRLGRRTAAELPETTRFLKAMGLEVNDILDRDPAEAFQLVSEKIASIENPAQQAAAAMGVFGDAGLQVLPAINQGLTENIERFRELGGAMSQETAQAAKEFGDSLTDLGVKFDQIKFAVGGVVIPLLEKMLTFFADILPGAVQKFAAIYTQWIADSIKRTAEFLSTLSALAPSLGDLSDKAFDMARSFEVQADELTKAAEANFLNALNMDKASKSADQVTISTKQFSDALVQVKDESKQTREQIVLTYDEALARLPNIVEAMDRWVKKTEDATLAWRGVFEEMETGIPMGIEGVGDLDALTDKATDTVGNLGDGFRNATTLMSQLGVESDSTLGRMIQFGESAIQIFTSILGLISNITGGLGGLGRALSNLGGGAGGLGGILGGLPGIGAIAGIAGLGIGAIAGLFDREASAETTAEALGIDFDALSRDLQNGLQQLGEQVGDFSTAIALRTGDIVEELLAKGIITPAEALERIGNVFSAVDQGLIDSATAGLIVEDSMQRIEGVLGDLGPDGQAQLERIVSAADRLNVSLAGVEDLLRRVGAAAASIPPLPSGGAVGPTIPMTPAASGFEGRVRGPRAFFVEPGVTEDVSITRAGSRGGGHSLESMASYIGSGGLARDIARAVRDEARK